MDTNINFTITRADKKYMIILENHLNISKRLKAQYNINDNILLPLYNRLNNLFINGISESITLTKEELTECEKVLKVIYRNEA